jgi:hypothetical protein
MFEKCARARDAYATRSNKIARHTVAKKLSAGSVSCCYGPRASEGVMAQPDVRARVLEEWFRLPESRRRYATDAVAFAFRILRERPDLVNMATDLSHESIVTWLLPHIRSTAGIGMEGHG